MVLIFVKHIKSSEELCEVLKDTGIPVGCLHGDMDQLLRENVIENFFNGKLKVIVATDVASRGINIPSIRTVINFDCPKDVETHIHRIGRTARDGEGTAVSLLTNFDKKFAGDLLLNLEYNEQEIPEKLEKIAMEDQLFRIQRMKNDKNKIRYCKTGNIETANAIMNSIGKKKVDFSTDMTSEDFRQQINGQQREYFQQDFKQKFVNSGKLTNDITETTVSYLEKPRKKNNFEQP